eukprot:COSAG01_NODE_13523_length_1573_cov_1.053596_1_plen_96_part_00
MLSAEAVDVVLLEHSLAALRGLLTVRGPSWWVVHTAELAGISLCDACSCHEILRRNCPGQVSSNNTQICAVAAAVAVIGRYWRDGLSNMVWVVRL